MKLARTSLAALTAAAALVTTGCNGSNPTAPQAPPPEIKTPVGAVVTSISVTKFPAKKTDGSYWDFSLITADRRPDLYVILTAANQAADYVSNTVSNAVTGTVYTFTKAKDSSVGHLPAYLPYDTSRRVYVMDDDFGGDDDRLGWITVNLPHAYGGDNARSLDYTFTDSGNRLSVRVRGTWNY